MTISYPVDVENTRWAVWQVSASRIVGRDKVWPRADGGPIEGQDPDYVYLLQQSTTEPDYDSRLFVLVADETVDVPNNLLTRTWSTTPRDLDERKMAAENEESFQFTRHFRFERLALETALMLGLIYHFAIDGQSIPARYREFADSYRDRVKDKLLPNRDRLLAIIAELEAGTTPDMDAGWTVPDA